MMSDERIKRHALSWIALLKSIILAPVMVGCLFLLLTKMPF